MVLRLPRALAEALVPLLSGASCRCLALDPLLSCLLRTFVLLMYYTPVFTCHNGSHMDKNCHLSTPLLNAILSPVACYSSLPPRSQTMTYLIKIKLNDGQTKVVDSSATTERQACDDGRMAYLKNLNAVSFSVKKISNMYVED